MNPLVSIIVVNYEHPEVCTRLFNSLPMTTDVPYEVVCVDNGSGPETVARLRAFKATGKITRLICEKVNHFFSEGNNIGLRHSNPESKYILFLNSDVEIMHPLWLLRMIEWMEGIPKTLMPYTWSDHPAQPTREPRDIVSIGWSRTVNVPGEARPEGWCCMLRRSVCGQMSPDFPMCWGFEEMIAKIIQPKADGTPGGRAGVLCQYSCYIRHHEQGSEGNKLATQIINRRQPDEVGWFAGCNPPETLDFALGEHEHSSYLQW